MALGRTRLAARFAEVGPPGYLVRPCLVCDARDFATRIVSGSK